MVARNRIRCTVHGVESPAGRIFSRGAMSRDLLPWADPYLAMLIKKLQDEVRHERQLERLRTQRNRFSQSIREYERTQFGGQEK